MARAKDSERPRFGHESSFRLPTLQHRRLNPPSSVLAFIPQCLSSASPLAPSALPHSPASRSHRASSVSTRPELSASPASSVPTSTHTTLTTRRASRSSPPGESIQDPNTCHRVTSPPFRDHPGLAIASEPLLARTSTYGPIFVNC